MNLYCKLVGHTFVHRWENPKISWNAGKDQAELHMTTDEEPRFWLECARCGKRIDDPTREQIKRAHSNYRLA